MREAKENLDYAAPPIILTLLGVSSIISLGVWGLGLPIRLAVGTGAMSFIFLLFITILSLGSHD